MADNRHFYDSEINGKYAIDTVLSVGRREFLDHCIMKYESGCDISSEAISVSEWKYILARKPEMEIILDKFIDWKNAGDGIDIAIFISFNSEFEKSLRRSDAWRYFEANEWVFIIINTPQYTDKCDDVDGWAKFSHDDWEAVIDFRPSLFGKSKSYGYTGDLPDWAKDLE